MTESKHTPGPWSLYTDAKGRVSKIESKTGRVCTLQPADKNGNANAALIARAPDLLREVEDLRAENTEMATDLARMTSEAIALRAQNAEMLGALVWLDRRGGLGHEAHDRIRAAIAKAKGGVS